MSEKPMTPDDRATLKQWAEVMNVGLTNGPTKERAQAVLGLIAALERLEQEQARLTKELREAKILLDRSPLSEVCDKCKTRVPRYFIAVEVVDGGPIDDPAGFMWCIRCHANRVLESEKRRAEAAERDLALAREKADNIDALLILRGYELEALRATLARVEGERDALEEENAVYAEARRHHRREVVETAERFERRGRAAERAELLAKVRAFRDDELAKANELRGQPIYEVYMFRVGMCDQILKAWQDAHAGPEAPQAPEPPAPGVE